ncbi:uncharacterized protein LOC105380114 [Plutella xylostella]|uniref:uncharacterized protein LOC105380114 n=1 Tax=Plutella xylostella TaxID=51655 RepID=UPI00203270DC|nr:uncharacterized protein LOC105380114 [Plutella xylostella]
MVPLVILVVLCSNSVFGQIFEEKQNLWPGAMSNIVPSGLVEGGQPCSRRAFQGSPESLKTLPLNENEDKDYKPDIIFNSNSEISEDDSEIEYKDNIFTSNVPSNTQVSKCSGAKTTNVKRKSNSKSTPLELSNKRSLTNNDLHNNILPSDYQIEPPRNTRPLHEALIKATKAASKITENKPESSEDNDCPFKIRTPNQNFDEKEPVHLENRRIGDFVEIKGDGFVNGIRTPNQNMDDKEPVHRENRRTGDFVENKGDGFVNDNRDATGSPRSAKSQQSADIRVCYACSTTNDPSCQSPNPKNTTVKYCRQPYDACVTKTFKVEAGTVLTRDCGTSCEDYPQQSSFHPVASKCSACHTNLCNGAYSVTAQNIFFIFSVALLSIFKLSYFK